MPECEFRFASKQKLEEHALLAHSLDIKVELSEPGGLEGSCISGGQDVSHV